MRGSVLLLDPDGVHLRTAAAPNLPTAYSSAIDGVAIGPEVGSCGTAAYTKRPKIAADIASDPAWRDYRGLALDHGLRACWSVPILGTSGQVLGTFAFYFDAPRDATPSEQESLERGAQLASVAIERYRAEASLRESEHRREVALFGAELGLWDWNVRTGVVVYDDRWCAMLGYRVDELAPDVASWTSLMHPDDREPVQVRLEPHLKGETPDYETEFRLRHRDGHWVWIQARGKVVERDAAGAPLRMAGTHMDIGPRKRAEAALREGDARNAKLEEQLHQAAKMQTVGRLAGGVAHDFNNMLAVILGHVEAALAGGDPEQLREDLLAIQQAGTRAADVTQQLLAFARQQTVVPRVLDLNDMVTSMLKLLGRLLGEQIEIRWQPAAGLWAIEMDPTQVDQIVTNLCVNARDAIADVGTIVITTENLVVAAEFCNDRPELSPGDYVRLSVADDGAGIDHVFEPFFTTKGVGEGTGLGLATVYGAVRQNRGHVTVASERGRGTTFEILLPRAPPALVPTLVAPPTATPRAAEIILLVEDEPALLRIVTRHLQGQGYTVLTANDPHEAVRLAREPGVRIDLLVTDVIMPKMNGRELATALLAFHPHLRCLFMSGYTADVIGGRGMLSPDVHFIQKPFSRADLVAKARAALGGKV
jgi:PAS domain S-box-containing protein